MISGPWGHDRTWERSVVERIRRGGAAPRMVDSGPSTYWEPVSAYADGWEFAEARSRDAIRTSAVYLNDEAIAARALQRKLLREGIREALAEAEARRKKIEADRKAEAAARSEIQRQWEAQRAERERKAREQEEAWQKEADRRIAEYKASREKQQAEDRERNRSRYEIERILGSKWICTVCGGGASWIKRDGEGYRITCTQCGKSAWGSHESLWGVLSK
jgi:hypothetical protein